MFIEFISKLFKSTPAEKPAESPCPSFDPNRDPVQEPKSGNPKPPGKPWRAYRSRAVSATEERSMVRMRLQGKSLREIAEVHGRGVSTVWFHVAGLHISETVGDGLGPWNTTIEHITYLPKQKRKRKRAAKLGARSVRRRRILKLSRLWKGGCSMAEFAAAAEVKNPWVLVCYLRKRDPQLFPHRRKPTARP